MSKRAVFCVVLVCGAWACDGKKATEGPTETGSETSAAVSANEANDDAKEDGKEAPAAEAKDDGEAKEAGGGGEGPEAVAKRYTLLGGEAKFDEVKALVDPACHGNKALMEVQSVTMLGARMKVDAVETELKSEEGEQAVVKVTAKGSLDGASGKKEGKIGKAKFKVKVNSIKASSMSRGTTLQMKKLDGGWKVSCK